MSRDTASSHAAEFAAWHRVVKLLKKTGAVTAADCTSSIGATMETDGQRLFEAIREWGIAKARLAIDTGEVRS